MPALHPATYMKQLQLALSFLTRFPVREISSPLPQLHHSFWAFGVVGAGLGAIYAAIILLGLWLGLNLMITAIIAVSCGLICTGALHEDGFADMFDGFGGGKTPEDKLRIMQDSVLGSYGVSALILILLLRVVTLAVISPAMVDAGFSLVLNLAIIAGFSRICMAGMLVLTPPARPNGLGSHFSSNEYKVPASKNLLAAFLLILLLSLFAPWGMLWVLGGMALVTFILAKLAKQQIGGQTGDVCGAVQISTETAGWIALGLLLAA